MIAGQYSLFRELALDPEVELDYVRQFGADAETRHAGRNPRNRVPPVWRRKELIADDTATKM